jgi:hypothetical protein
MNCPKCGLQILPDQKFCRSCGDSLQMVTRPLAEFDTASRPGKAPVASFPRQQLRTDRLALWGFIIMFMGAAIGVIGKKLMHDEIVTVVGVLISLAGMFLSAYPYLSPSSPEKYDSSASTQPEELTPSQSTKHLPQESDIEYVPSITERTTDLLKTPTATRPKQKQGGES